MTHAALSLVGTLFWVYRLVIIVRALLPWFGVSHYHPVMGFLIRITEPVLGPLRRAFPPAGGIDFSPLIALFVIWAVELLLNSLLLAPS